MIFNMPIRIDLMASPYEIQQKFSVVCRLRNRHSHRHSPPHLNLQDGNALKVLRNIETREANQLHGLSRSLLNSMVIGVNDGFEKTLQMVGVGYKAATSGESLTLNLGYSHPIEMSIPQGISVKVEKNTTIVVSGFDKEVVGQFAANIRSKREPEPYKGKGVRYSDEIVARKEGKRGK